MKKFLIELGFIVVSIPVFVVMIVSFAVVYIVTPSCEWENN